MIFYDKITFFLDPKGSPSVLLQHVETLVINEENLDDDIEKEEKISKNHHEHDYVPAVKKPACEYKHINCKKRRTAFFSAPNSRNSCQKSSSAFVTNIFYILYERNNMLFYRIDYVHSNGRLLMNI